MSGLSFLLLLQGSSGGPNLIMIIGVGIALLVGLGLAGFAFSYGSLYIQAWLSNAHVGIMQIVGMRIVGLGVGGVKPQLMGLGPVVSTVKAFRHAGIEAGAIDRVEFNEAFSAQVIPSVRELGIPLERVNVNGGSLGIGHPLGATGARLVTTVGKELRRSGGRYGLATQCIGAGMGISTVIERLD